MDYPALYHSSDELSILSQKAFFRATFWHLLFLVIAALISVVNIPSAEFAILQVMVLLGALACSVYLFSTRPDRHWYAGRAVAESIKTVTWRFIIRAEPFNGDDEVDRHQFVQTLKSIVEQNRDVFARLGSCLEGEQITESMIAIRQLPMEKRITHYVESRIGDQRRWYAKKSEHNRRMATRFFMALIVTNAVTVCFAIGRIRFPSVSCWPTDVLVALALGLLSWIQAKRYSVLAGSYALAAHEIGLIKEQSENIRT